MQKNKLKNLTLWRKLLYSELEKLELNGKVIDLGGSKKSAYHKLIKGDIKITTVNLNQVSDCDLNFNLEKKFPLDNESYDYVLVINVLEHIFNHQNFIKECKRILKPGGKLIIAVPFIIQVHPSPSDYYRYTRQCLEKLLKQSEFKTVETKAIGKGVFSASAQIKFNVLHFSLLRQVVIKINLFLDKLMKVIKKDNLYNEKYYPLGYLAIARK